MNLQFDRAHLPSKFISCLTVLLTGALSGIGIDTAAEAEGTAFPVKSALAADPFVDFTIAPLDTSNGPIAWYDYNDDGRVDLYLANSGNPNKLLRNDGSGIFSDVTFSPLGDSGAATGVAWGDYDNDGNPDLYLARSTETNKLFRGLGWGTYSDATSGPLGTDLGTHAISWVDYDNDGLLDLSLSIISNFSGYNLLLHNDGNGAFTEYRTNAIVDYAREFGAAWGDYDDDGDLDVYLVKYGAANLLLRNDGTIPFAEVTASPLDDAGNGKGASWIDYDNDGDLDIYLVNNDSANKLLRNDGGGTFVDATSSPLDGLAYDSAAWADYDNDGDLDVCIGGAWFGFPPRLLSNEGGGNFSEVPSATLSLDGTFGFAWADVDNDGDMDLYLSRGFQSKLLENTVGADNHWLHVKLVGIESNRMGIGARVRIVAGGQAQIRQISSGAGFASRSEVIAAFGLGGVSVVDTLQVSWPYQGSNKVQNSTVLTNIDADQVLLVEENSATAVEGEPSGMRPSAYRLYASYPNPFNPATIIAFDLPARTLVDLKVYDVSGRLVRTLANQRGYEPGHQTIRWDGRNDAGRTVTAGVYFYELSAGDYRQARRMTLVK